MFVTATNKRFRDERSDNNCSSTLAAELLVHSVVYKWKYTENLRVLGSVDSSRIHREPSQPTAFIFYPMENRK